MTSSRILSTSTERAAVPMHVRRSIEWTCICSWIMILLHACPTPTETTEIKQEGKIWGSLSRRPTTSPEVPTSQSQQSVCPLGPGGISPDGQIHCCKNGGVPLLGTLCACPRNYDGRWCELRRQNCLRIPHGKIFRTDCTICRCLYGILSCISQAFKHCEGKSGDDSGGVLRSYDTRQKSGRKKKRLIPNTGILAKLTSSGSSTNQISLRVAAVILVAIFLRWEI